MMAEGGSPHDISCVVNEEGSVVTYEKNFLSPSESSFWMQKLLVELPWEEEKIRIFGKIITVRRQSCAIGEPGQVYRYAGVEKVANPWPVGFLEVVDRLRRATGMRYRFALCNLYPDGQAGVGWHADDEPELVSRAPIASLSLGATRDFSLRRGKSGGAVWTVALESGSLLWMGGTTQERLQHEVPKRVRCKEPRINLTFRQFR
jgi:alkylated DNA repair dioxygenase AlkB